MFARIGVIALNTYREAVRARLLHGLFALTVSTVLYSVVVGAFALGGALRVISDLGAASVSLYAVVVAITVGGTSLHRELELKTLFPVLARPIERWEYLVGKFFGTLLTLATFIGANMAVSLVALAVTAQVGSVRLGLALGLPSLGIAGVLWRAPRARTWLPIPAAAVLLLAAAWLAGGAPDDRRVVLLSGLLSLAEVAIVIAVASLFSSFSSPFLSALFTLGVFLVGRSADTLGRLPERMFGASIHALGRGAAWVFPNLMVYVPPRALLTGESAAPVAPYLGLAMLQSAAWCLVLLALSAWLFRRRDIA